MKRSIRMIFILFVLTILPFVSMFGQTGNQKINDGMTVHSKNIHRESMIPSQYTCDGINISPELSWWGFPPETMTFALICSDPDASSGNWTHWVLFNIPATVNHLPEDFTVRHAISKEIKTGTNDAGQPDYFGPCPPSGIHRYYFRIYALNTHLQAKEGISAGELHKLMDPHILATGELMGKYKRKELK
jgi:Raf kinase inhibitor-like YbhB/YbcL family protein